MKKLFLLLLFYNYHISINHINAQGVWTEHNGIGMSQPSSEVPHERNSAAGFGVAGIAYMGTGAIDQFVNVVYLNDWFAYDPSTNLWTPKAFLPTTGRSQACGFQANGKGYVGLGVDQSVGMSDLWEYDQVSDSWTQKNSFPGTPRREEFCFSLNGKGYLGGGIDGNNNFFNDFWEYDPSVNNWNPKAAFPNSLVDAASFSINQFGYVTGGIDTTWAFQHTTYRYDQTIDFWDTVATFPLQSNPGSAFTIMNYGYVTSDSLYQYDPVSDIWNAKSPIVNAGYDTRAITINNLAYLIGGDRSVYEYNPVTDSLIEKYKSPSLFPRPNDRCIVIGDTAYGGICKYAIPTDSWSIDSSLLNTNWICSIDSVGYAARNNSFQKYNSAIGSWTLLPPFPVSPVVSFCLNSKIYVGLGTDSLTNPTTELWEYDPVINNWSRKADFPGSNRYSPSSFTLKDRGYVAGGWDTLYNVSDNFWEYDSWSDAWTQKANIIGARIFTFGIEYNNQGYLGFGLDDPVGLDYCDLRKYDPVNDSWSSSIIHPFGCRSGLTGFVANNKFYLGGGVKRYTMGYSDQFHDLWSYDEITSVGETDSEKNIFIYPNPTSSAFSIQTTYQLYNAQIEIFNLLGAKVLVAQSALSGPSPGNQNSNSEMSVDVHSLNPGIYWLEVSSGEKVFRSKFVKQ